MSVMRLFSLVFVLVASLVHSEEVPHLREAEKLSEASGVKEETGKEVTAVGAVSNDVPHDIEGEDEDPEEVGVVIEEPKKSPESGVSLPPRLEVEQRLVSWGALTQQPVLRPLTVSQPQALLTLDQPFGWLIRRLEKRGCFL